MTQAPNAESAATTDPDALATLVGHMEDMRTVMVTTVTADGSLTSRPMTVQEVEENGDLWFIGSQSSDMVGEIRADDRVNVAFSSSSDFVSLYGHARITSDMEKVRELWDRPTDAWFEQGPDDPDVALVHVAADSAQYWDTPGQVATLVAMLKSSVTDDGNPDIGDTRELDL
jgi:general stress protein 26